VLASRFSIRILSAGAWLVAATVAPAAKPPADDATIEAGRQTYMERCWFCHGEEGDGFGPVADYLDPRPRDFTLGTYKLRTTHSGELPTDEDLFRTVSRGIPGTAMPAWETYLDEDERWQVIRYIQTFAPEFENPEFDPYKKVVESSSPVPPSAESIARGKELFRDAKCFECHGVNGRGDGQKSASMEDDWGYPLRVRNLTHGWTIKGGAEPEDIFLRFTTGINGTPMPSFAQTMSEEDRWHLANYISREVVQNPRFDKIVLKAERVDGELPGDPWDDRWDETDFLDIPMAGQILAKPRWQNHAVQMVTLRALYNDDEIAFQVTWDDPFEDRVHREELEWPVESMSETYAWPFADDLPRKPGTFRDAVALQFPARAGDGPRKPHFFRGAAGQPVQLWMWESDRRDRGEPAVHTVEARGFGRPLKTLGEEQQSVTGSGVWQNGQWRVVFRRPRSREDEPPGPGLGFGAGSLVPVAVEAWEGANGEHGLLMSLSTWHYLYLERSTPGSVYALAFLGLAVTAGGEWWVVRRVRRRGRGGRP